ncbi:MAG TPA: G5 domain-containing protein [Patescibacteria group bacterium]|nr:G5 domain-containing protein [Patescibacteria group bacterium]
MQRKFKRFRRNYATTQRNRIHRLKILSRHPFAVPFFVFLTLLALLAAGYVAFGRSNTPAPTTRVVIISHDSLQQTVPSIEPTVGALLNKLHIQLNQGDVVEPSLATAIKQDDFRINIYRAVPVEIIDNGHKTFTFSAATTPRSIVKQANYSVFPEDNINTAPTDNFLSGGAIGEQVVIERSVPVNVNLYGTLLQIRTRATTVGDLIKEKNIKLAKDDQVDPVLATPILAGQQIMIARNGTKVETEVQTIPTPVKTIYDSGLAYGTSAVRQAGSPGQQVVTYQDNLVNGVVVSRKAVQTVVTIAPVTQIVAQGTNLAGIKGDMALAGIAPSDYNYVDYIVSHESGWCPTKAQGEHYCPSPPDNSMTPNGYGLCQATPGYKMASSGSDWATNPVTQLKWCNGYAVSRYGSWYAAYNHWVAYHSW